MNLVTILLVLFAFTLPLSKRLVDISMLWPVIGVFWMFYKYKQDKTFSMILQQPLIKPVIFFLGCLLVTVPFSINVSESLKGYYGYLGNLAPLIMFIVLRMIGTQYYINVHHIIHAFFAGLAVVCLYASYNFIITHKLGTAGFYNNRIYFGYILEVAIPLVLSMAIAARTVKQRSVYGILLVLYGVTVLLTQARGPWMGIVVGMAVVLFIHRKKITRRIAMIGVVAILLFGIIATPFYFERAKTIINSDHRTNVQRVRIWEYTLEMIKDYPIAGMGFKQYDKKYPEYIEPTETLMRMSGHAHNSYLMIFVETGVIGFLGLMYLLFSISKTLLSILRRGDYGGITSGFCGVFCAVLITSLMDVALFFPVINRMFWLQLGVALYSASTEAKS